MAAFFLAKGLPWITTSLPKIALLYHTAHTLQPSHIALDGRLLHVAVPEGGQWLSVDSKGRLTE